jgi:hypothetical protein
LLLARKKVPLRQTPTVSNRSPFQSPATSTSPGEPKAKDPSARPVVLLLRRKTWPLR